MRARKDGEFRRLLASRLNTAPALYVRLPEKAEKLALLHAISENPGNPVISLDAVLWAMKLVTHLTRRMLYLSQFYVAEGAFDRLKKRVLGLIAKNGGQIDRSTLLKNMNIDSATLQKIILTLHMSNLIEEEMISRRQTIYTLTAA